MNVDLPEEDTAPPESQEELRLPGLQFVAILYAVLTCSIVVLLFIALVSAAMEKRMYGGLMGAQAVYLYSAIAALLVAQWTWLRNSSMYALSTGRDRPAEDVRHDRGARTVFFLLFLACVCAFNTSFRGEWHFGLAPGHDQPQYYAYLHSWIFDHDLDFENELKAIPGAWDLMVNAHPDRPEFNVAPIGSPILWLPFYLAGHAVISGFNAWGGTEWPTDGIAAPYAVAAAFGSMVLGLAGLLLTHAGVRSYFSHRTAFFAVLLMATGSPLTWYVVDQPLMSHAPSFFVGALVFYLWAGWRDTASFTRYALLGAAIGLAMLVRPSHAALLLLPAMDWIVHTARTARGELEQDSTEGDLPPFARAGIRLGLFLGMAVLVFVPQLITWYLRDGFDAPPGSPMQWLHPQMGSVLFSAQHGLFAWHPITYAGFLGVPLLWWRSRSLCIGVASVLLMYTYFNGAIESWWGGGSFGMRRFVGTLAFITPGIAAFGRWVVVLVRRKPTVLIWATAGLLISWNAALTIASRQGYISLYEPKTFETVWQGAATVTHDRIGNPFSYPVNLWFALKHGVSPGRFDYLSGFRLEPFLGTPDANAGPDFDVSKLKPVEGANVKTFLGRGWRDTIADLRRHRGEWCSYSKRPTLLLPMRKGWSYTLELSVMPPPPLGGSQIARFFVNDKQIGKTFELPANELTGLRLDIPGDATIDGVNTVLIELAHEKTFVARATGDRRPGAGLTVDTWNKHTETLYLRGFKLVPK